MVTWVRKARIWARLSTARSCRSRDRVVFRRLHGPACTGSRMRPAIRSGGSQPTGRAAAGSAGGGPGSGSHQWSRRMRLQLKTRSALSCGPGPGGPGYASDCRARWSRCGVRPAASGRWPFAARSASPAAWPLRCRRCPVSIMRKNWTRPGPGKLQPDRCCHPSPSHSNSYGTCGTLRASYCGRWSQKR